MSSRIISLMWCFKSSCRLVYLTQIWSLVYLFGSVRRVASTLQALHMIFLWTKVLSLLLIQLGSSFGIGKEPNVSICFIGSSWMEVCWRTRSTYSTSLQIQICAHFVVFEMNPCYNPTWLHGDLPNLDVRSEWVTGSNVLLLGFALVGGTFYALLSYETSIMPFPPFWSVFPCCTERS